MGLWRYLVVLVAAISFAATAQAGTVCVSGCMNTSVADPTPGVHSGARMETNRLATESAINNAQAQLDAIENTNNQTSGPVDLTPGTTIGGIAPATNGANCAAGSFPLGVDGANAVEGCTPQYSGATDIDSAGAIKANAIALATDTVGAYCATITGDTEIVVGGSGNENAAITLSIGGAITRDTELDAKSAATSTTNAVPKFSNGTGDEVNSNILMDSGGNNLTVPGTITIGTGTGPTCLIGRNSADTGNVSCRIIGTTFTCEVDTDGTCGNGI